MNPPGRVPTVRVVVRGVRRQPRPRRVTPSIPSPTTAGCRASPPHAARGKRESDCQPAKVG